MWYLEYNCKANFNGGGAQHVRDILSTELDRESYEAAKRIALAKLSELNRVRATEITFPELVWRELVSL